MIRSRAIAGTALGGWLATAGAVLAIAPMAAAAGVAPDAAALNNNAGDLFSRIWPYLLGLLVLAVVGGLFAMWLRRRLSSAEEGATPGFTLEDLRQMHRRGEMSDEEFAHAKAAMLSKRPSREEMADKLIVRGGGKGKASGGKSPGRTKGGPPKEPPTPPDSR